MIVWRSAKKIIANIFLWHLAVEMRNSSLCVWILHKFGMSILEYTLPFEIFLWTVFIWSRGDVNWTGFRGDDKFSRGKLIWRLQNDTKIWRKDLESGSNEEMDHWRHYPNLLLVLIGQRLYRRLECIYWGETWCAVNMINNLLLYYLWNLFNIPFWI